VLLGLIRAREYVRGDRCSVCEHTKLVDDLRSRNVNIFGAAEKQYVLRDPRRHVDVIHHSDQGCQYTSIAFGRRCQEAGVRPSMGSVGDCYDNAMCESFNATLECELLDRHRFKTQREAALAVFDFIEGWYNPHRRHTSIGNISPVEYERRSLAA
jgi:transposase InsO family protein